MPATALLTSEQYLSLSEEFDQNGNRIKDELIRGEVVKMPPSAELPNIVRSNVLEALMPFLLANPGLGMKTLAEMAYVVTGQDALVPDVSVLSISRLRPRQEKYINGAPEIAIEVVSPTDRAAKLKSKVDTYLRGGSRTVWVVYPKARSVMVHSADSVRELKGDQPVEDALLPGFSTPVSRFFHLT